VSDYVDFQPTRVFDKQNRDDVEHKQGYSDIHLKEYAVKLEQENERLSGRAEFLIQADVKKDVEEMEQKQMETLNLFGLPMDESGSFDASAASKDL